MIELSAFYPPPFSCAEDQRLNALCPVCVLRGYIDSTSPFRRPCLDFLGHPNTRNHISKECLSHQLIEAISLACESKEVHPGDLRAHFTRGMASMASWALF